MADVSRALELPREPLDSLPDDPSLWAEVPLELLVRYGCVPVRREGERVVLAFGRLDDDTKLDEIEFLLERPVEAVLAPAERVAAALRRHRGGEILLEQASEGLRLQLVADDETAGIEEKLVPSESPIVRLVDSLVLGAIDRRASDIHIETKEREVLAKYRIDGVLHPALEPLDKKHHDTIVSRLKVMAELDITERRQAHDGRARLIIGGRELDVRVSTLPSLHGESVVLRLLDTARRPMGLEQLGTAEDTLEALRRCAAQPHGVLLATGPTGSGKTSTLYALVERISSGREKIVSVEDPVEYELPGVVQVPVREKGGVTFDRALRSMLRHDPDVLLVGELRDPETVEVCMQAALTGHLVLSTLHTNDAPSALTRLLDLGVAPYLVGSTVEAVLAQRLTRRLCGECAVGIAAPESVREEMRRDGMDADSIRIAVGCPACRGTGYRGRTGIFELLVVDDEIRDAVTRRDGAGQLRRLALEHGMRPLRADGWRQVGAGVTTVEEVRRVLPAGLGGVLPARPAAAPARRRARTAADRKPAPAATPSPESPPA